MKVKNAKIKLKKIFKTLKSLKAINSDMDDSKEDMINELFNNFEYFCEQYPNDKKLQNKLIEVKQERDESEVLGLCKSQNVEMIGNDELSIME